MVSKKLLKIGLLQLVVVILVYIGLGTLSNYYHDQTSAHIREARNAGYNSKIEATLYDIQPYTHKGKEYLLVYYGNTDMFGGHYSDYALIAKDTDIDKYVKIDKRFCLMYEGSERVTVYVEDIEYPGELIDAYNMVRIHKVSDTALLLTLVILPFSGLIFVALAIAALIVYIVKKQKEAAS